MTDNEEDIIVCRCSDVKLSEIRDLIKKGCTTLDEIKRLSRAGMGQCQGKTCRNLIMQELSNALSIPIQEIEASTFRPPVVTIPLGSIVEEVPDEE